MASELERLYRMSRKRREDLTERICNPRNTRDRAAAIRLWKRIYSEAPLPDVRDVRGDVSDVPAALPEVRSVPNVT